ncbi:response regulator [Herbiconiux sp. P17]|uniref:response regulator n=1 Tax=Herbiconiux wuyangfengii TaxID=3342794 RepID=UPI0035BB1043
MRVVIVDDEVLLRRGLRLVLEDAEFEVVAELGDTEGLDEVVDRLRPDLVITDIRVPPTHTNEGLIAALRVRQAYPEVAVVVLSQHVQSRYAHELLRAGTGRVGYLLKQRIADVDSLVDDLHRVVAGGTALDPLVARVLVDRAERARSGVERLTARQKDVLALMAEGKSNASIAASLFLTEKAVVQHASRLYDALGLSVDPEAHRRVLAVVEYLNRDHPLPRKDAPR